MTETPCTGDDLLKAREASAILGIGLRTFERYVKDGHITTYRLPNGHRRWRRTDVRALAVAQVMPNHAA